jgi:glycerol-3-phosphate dehydrogenase
MKRELDKLTTKPFDILVVGGGIHGALAVWDAALRGLSAALIERGDFGGATSQNSLKIIHGGLRYVQDGNPFRIRTMARERTTWMRIAPHLVHPLTCLMPTRPKMSRSRLALGTAMTINDLLSFDRNRSMDPQKYLAGGKIISRQELACLLPGYNLADSTGAAVWQDAQIYNSERLLLEFLLSATEIGAVVANYVEATGLLRKGQRVSGVTARDVITGQAFDIPAKVVINCAGAWTEKLLEGVDAHSGQATSIAMNVIVDQVWSRIAAGLPSHPIGGRPSQILFFVPWQNRTMIGTWHLPWKGQPDAFKLSEAVVQRFLDEINSAHLPRRLTLDDVHHVTWGFLPVPDKDDHRDTIRLTRDGVIIDHQKQDGLSGLISVLGVKYTTARMVAERAVDLAESKVQSRRIPCQTQTRPVHGGQIGRFQPFLTQALSAAPRGLNEELVEHLVYTYGSDHRHFVEDMIRYPELQERVDIHLPVSRAEVVHAVHHEMAMKLEDVIQRRTELGASGLPTSTVLQKCAEIMGSELGWSLERQQQEIDSVIRRYPLRNMERVFA